MDPAASTQHFDRIKEKQGAPASDDPILPTPRGRSIRTKGLLNKKEYLPMKSSKWGQMRNSLVIDPQAQQDGLHGDGKLSFVSPLSQLTKDSNQKATRLQETFTQKLKSCPSRPCFCCPRH